MLGLRGLVGAGESRVRCALSPLEVAVTNLILLLASVALAIGTLVLASWWAHLRLWRGRLHVPQATSVDETDARRGTMAAAHLHAGNDSGESCRL